jgi:hypothetical protein
MLCIKCNKEIPAGRLKALPNTKVCVACSDTSKVAGFRVITGKSTYTEMQIVDQDTYNKLSKLQQRYGSVAVGNTFQSYEKANIEVNKCKQLDEDKNYSL